MTFTLDEIQKAAAAAQINLASETARISVAFESQVRKVQRNGETFEQAYAREVQTPDGQHFYSELQRLKRLPAVIAKATRDAALRGQITT